MSTETEKPTDTVLVRRRDLDDLFQALRNYQHMTLHEGNAWGQQDARDTLSRLGFGAGLFMANWYGHNHQRITAGTTVRVSDERTPGSEHEFSEGVVLEPLMFGAYVECEHGVDWFPWQDVHLPDRLHTEPNFDINDHEAIALQVDGVRHNPTVRLHAVPDGLGDDIDRDGGPAGEVDQ